MREKERIGDNGLCAALFFHSVSPPVGYSLFVFVSCLSLIGRWGIFFREEYLVLLPETLPFLAELMEDPVEEVEAEVQELLAELTELSGEDLKEMLA
jgi:hypothetical protein